jgi:uridylate kinase
MRVVLSVGGSVLVPDLAHERVAAYADVIESLDDDGHDVGAVVGGGATAREYIETGRALGADEIELDQLGIAVTRLNARLLLAALDERAVSTPTETYDEGREAIRRGVVPVLGGTVAGQTTDAVSAAFAEFVDADVLVLATSVPGVFDGDPNEVDGATQYDEVTTADLVDLVADIELTAGSNAPVDLLAAKIIHRGGLRTVVIGGTDPDRVAAAIRSGEHEGTDVVPPGVEEPAAWAGR